MKRAVRASSISLYLALGLLLSGAAWAQDPLFTFVQISDSQPVDSADQAQFEEVLDSIAEAGQSGALLPFPVDFVLFAGDLVDDGGNQSEYVTWVQTMDSRLTANDIAFLAVPGNHDDAGGSNFNNYEQYVADSAAWDAESWSFTGHNGVQVDTSWEGLRFIGVNNDNGGANQVSSSDVAAVETFVAEADVNLENAFVMGHYPHDHNGRFPLRDALEASNLVGYLRGHTGSPAINQGLSGTSNSEAWDVNTNSIWNNGGLAYFEVFRNEIDAYVLRLSQNPSGLPSPETITLVHSMRARGGSNPPTADFSATPTAGGIPLAVAFTDLSAGSPTSWQWTFGDGASSTARNPNHTYTSPGAYTVTLSVSNAAGSDSLTRSGYINVGLPQGTTLYNPVADARVKVGSTTNYATDPLRVKQGSSSYDSYLRFDVQNLAAPAVESAVLRLFVTDGGPDGGAVHQVANGWGETSINGTNAPAISGAPLASAGGVSTGTWVELEVTPAVTATGFVSFGLTNNASNSVYYSSREGAQPPQLLVTATDAVAPNADFSATPTTGTVPLTVDFNDLSTGSPTSWLWDFGDGSTSTARNPSHTYDTVGSYTVQLTVSNNVGSDVRVRSSYVVVGPVAPPTANFTAAPTAGPAPLTVSFSDLSAGNPTSWLWTFGDGTSSTARSPSHTYTAVGTYTVRLTVSNSGGSDATTRTDFITAEVPPPITTYNPIADARVKVGSTTNYASDPLRVKRGGRSIYESYLQFDVQALAAGAVETAVLRLYVTSGGPDGGGVHVVSNGWSESGINGTNAPPISGAPLASAGAVTTDTWIELDVTPAVTGTGIVSFGLRNSSSRSVYYASREGAQPPELVVTAGAGVVPSADFVATPAVGTVPLMVSFTDLSTGPPTSWLWDFGDGGSSTAQNPSHTYGSAGSYTVTLTATNSQGSDVRVRSGYIVVDPPSLPTADFTAAPTLGPAPLAVSFSDLSGGNPTSWQWSFGDGGGSSAQNPSHTYATPGSYSVTLTVSNPAGSDSVTRSGYVTAEVPPPITTFHPIADARVKLGSTTNYATDPLRVKDSSSIYESYLQFDLSGVPPQVSSAILRLYVTDGGPDGGTVYRVADGWSESGIDGTNAPPIGGTPLASAGPAPTDTWIELDVTAGVTGGGLVSLGLTNDATRSTYYSSREGPQPPELVVLAGDPVAPTADFVASTTAGTAPLAVGFTDLSTGVPTSWAWSFGDGGSSTSQHPSHTYTSTGSYTVTLTATNAEGSDSLTRSGYIVVGAPVPPTADFTASPTQGPAALVVAFTDLSGGNPTSWLWDFGDGSGSSAQHPTHTYASPGTYDVTLTVTNPASTDSVTRNGYISVEQPAPITTYNPVADAKVRATSPTRNYGAEIDLRVKDDGTKFWDSYLKFDVQAGASVSSAILRLYVTDASSDGGSVYRVDNGWTELGITYSNAPVISGAPLASAGAVTAGTWIELDVTSAISGSGPVSFGLASDGSNSALYSSREGSQPPELIVQTSP